MKRIAFLLVFFIVSIFSNTVLANTVELGSNGEVRVDNKETGVRVTKEAQKYPQWKKAYKNPGRLIPVQTHREHTPPDILHLQRQVISDTAMVYDTDKNIIKVVPDGRIIKSEVIFSIFIISCVISILMILMSNVRVWRHGISNEGCIFAVAGAIATVFAYTSSLFITVAIATAFSISVAVSSYECKFLKEYKIFSGVFYIFMFISIFFFYQ